MKPSRCWLHGLIFCAFFLAPSASLRAHCDSLDGPVVAAARKAIGANDPNLVLIWVRAEDESEIRAAFAKTLSVRKLSADARELADLFFFETLVRVHRAGEGAPFTGLKPAGEDRDATIPIADKTLHDGQIEPLLKFLSNDLAIGVRAHFDAVMRHRDYNKTDVAAGREFVQAYVEYIHCVEALHAQTLRPVHGHFLPKPGGEHSAHSSAHRE